MAVDDTKLIYSSNWEIDQLVDTNTISVSSGTTEVYSSDAILPLFDVQFKPSGSSYWYSPGENSTNGTVAGLFTFYTYYQNNKIYIVTTSAGTARYFVWSDKVDY